MTHNKKQTIPTAIPVEELAARFGITPNKLRLVIGLAAAARYTVDLGLGIRVKVAILDEAHLCDEAVMELAHIGSLDSWETHQSLHAATPGNEPEEGERKGVLMYGLTAAKYESIMTGVMTDAYMAEIDAEIEHELAIEASVNSAIEQAGL
jgi:hypothetical protein